MGSDVRGIGEEHTLRDSPMMIDGRVQIWEVVKNRVKALDWRVQESMKLFTASLDG